jgi:predicted acylesterase/phospholipase RssA
MEDFTGHPNQARFSILSIDGGGIRGLIPALIVKELERRLTPEGGPRARLADYFHLFVGTSTGGLIALGLNAEDKATGHWMDGAALEHIYRDEGPAIFDRGLMHKLVSVFGWRRPKHSDRKLEEVLKGHFGDVRLADARCEVVAVAYDMRARRPHFFKRYRAQESAERNPTLVEAAMATSCGPTYFPSYGVNGEPMVDGGVFAANPTIAAIAEALKRTDAPANLKPDELLVVSLGTGVHEKPSGFDQSQVSRWGKIGWVRQRAGELPLLEAIFDGQSEAADHWAHMIVNQPGDQPSDKDPIGHGPRYYRFQASLPHGVAMDDARKDRLDGLEAAAQELIHSRASELDDVAGKLRAMHQAQVP